ncbi:MAG: hypothetical protein J6T10_08620 [Methanobrevibacter sp.]|nr:hypothetical protein [Methanobrevibacter sp.]
MLDFDIKIEGHLELFLKDLKEEMKELSYLDSKKAEVGIFGNKDERTDGKSNADIGFYHEYGRGVPRRSFLEVPADEFQVAVLDKLTLKTIEVNKEFLSKLASMFLDRVKEEFETNGHGSWRPLSKSTKRKYNQDRDQLLRDSRQLYKSLGKRVVNK